MDNHQQLEEIEKYCRHLIQRTGLEVPAETAAGIWIRKYAKIWRLRHPAEEEESSLRTA